MTSAMRRAIVLLSWSVLFAFTLGARERVISRAEMGANWPLTVERVTLTCRAGAVTVTSEGVVYAVNGIAIGRKAGKDIDTLWAAPSPEYFVDPKTKKRINLAAPKKNIGPLIKLGNDLCE
jgi:hypothetical protein